MNFEMLKLRLRYRRSAPKTTVRHTVEGRFRPISVMYEENAFDGLSTLFTDDPNIYKTVLPIFYLLAYVFRLISYYQVKAMVMI